jgi:hypothetical protein
MAKRKTIGTSPLDAVVPVRAEETAPTAAAPVRTKATTTTKQRLTVHVSDDLVNRVKNVVYWTPGLTLAGLAEQAFAQIVDELEKENCGPFRQRKEELKGGRPLK